MNQQEKSAWQAKGILGPVEQPEGSQPGRSVVVFSYAPHGGGMIDVRNYRVTLERTSFGDVRSEILRAPTYTGQPRHKAEDPLPEAVAAFRDALMAQCRAETP